MMASTDGSTLENPYYVNAAMLVGEKRSDMSEC